MAQRNLFDLVPQLHDGVRPPPFAAARERLHQLNTWLGPAGTITPLHRDPYQNLLCQVRLGASVAGGSPFKPLSLVARESPHPAASALLCEMFGPIRLTGVWHLSRSGARSW